MGGRSGRTKTPPNSCQTFICCLQGTFFSHRRAFSTPLALTARADWSFQHSAFWPCNPSPYPRAVARRPLWMPTAIQRHGSQLQQPETRDEIPDIQRGLPARRAAASRGHSLLRGLGIVKQLTCSRGLRVRRQRELLANTTAPIPLEICRVVDLGADVDTTMDTQPTPSYGIRYQHRRFQSP